MFWRKKLLLVTCYVATLMSWRKDSFHGLIRFVGATYYQLFYYLLITTFKCHDTNIMMFYMQVAPTLVPLLKFYFHEEVRKAAVSGIELIMWISFPLVPRSLFEIRQYSLESFTFFSSHARTSALCKISCRERTCARSQWVLYKAAVWLYYSRSGWSIAQGHLRFFSFFLCWYNLTFNLMSLWSDEILDY